ncbi:uncharacterized protein LAESUDRAFT_762337 [Laetiporus sulphureus 93-53]|uniref:Uncharacterized protein n=1 Tax=Laetiporus sulphureus 93-53 TaxID=1314785 RepID=A0A165CJ74_9APHY|nr:uncharacterized protein LAESUDRAFT_762337 [Laetiporus sulphureus 93-53]KZT02907.1 hypothetical protein LAESUDRAFT_762337 [Laetiporus sulphureus 93-53]
MHNEFVKALHKLKRLFNPELDERDPEAEGEDLPVAQGLSEQTAQLQASESQDVAEERHPKQEDVQTAQGMADAETFWDEHVMEDIPVINELSTQPAEQQVMEDNGQMTEQPSEQTPAAPVSQIHQQCMSPPPEDNFHQMGSSSEEELIKEKGKKHKRPSSVDFTAPPAKKSLLPMNRNLEAMVKED